MDNNKPYISDEMLLENPLYLNTIPFDSLMDCVRDFLNDSEYEELLNLSKPYKIYIVGKDNNVVCSESSRRYLVRNDLMNFFLLYVEDYFEDFTIYQMKNKKLIQQKFLNMLKLKRQCLTFSDLYGSMLVERFPPFTEDMFDESLNLSISDCSRMLEDDLTTLVNSVSYFQSRKDADKINDYSKEEDNSFKNYDHLSEEEKNDNKKRDSSLNTRMPEIEVVVDHITPNVSFMDYYRYTHDKNDVYSRILKKINVNEVNEVLEYYINLLNMQMLSRRFISNISEFNYKMSLETFVSLFVIDPMGSGVKNVYSVEDINFVRKMLQKVLNDEVFVPEEIDRILNLSQFNITPIELNSELFQTYLESIKKVKKQEGKQDNVAPANDEIIHKTM